MRPFSHEPGALFLVPHTPYAARFFPTRVEWLDLRGASTPEPLLLPLTGPVHGFTVQQDLSTGALHMWGRYAEGFRRYKLQARPEGVVWTQVKGEEQILALPTAMQPPSLERLFLGSNKKQEWPLMRRRADWKELLPLWLALARTMPHLPAGTTGTFALLPALQAATHRGACFEPLSLLLRASFHGVLVPRLIDTDHQGIVPAGAVDPSTSPLPLLTESAACIRALFYREEGANVHLLPALPSPFACGKMTHVESALFGTLHFEWSKGHLRRVRGVAAVTGDIALHLPPSARAARRGKEHLVASAEGALRLAVQAGESVELDRFLG
jgi:hypothetical protein